MLSNSKFSYSCNLNWPPSATPLVLVDVLLSCLFNTAVMVSVMVPHRRRRAASWALLATPLLFFIYFSHYRQQRLPVHTKAPAIGTAGVVLASASRCPGASEAAHSKDRDQKAVTQKQADPQSEEYTGIREDRIELQDDDVELLRISHANYIAQAGELAWQLPFQKKSRGIVMTAGGKYVGIALTSLMLLRRSGTSLPVQLFLDAADDYDVELCETVLPSLGATCHFLDQMWNLAPEMPKLGQYQFKVFAIIFSSFQEVLFLDADCWPIRKPDYLFTSEPFSIPRPRNMARLLGVYRFAII